MLLEKVDEVTNEVNHKAVTTVKIAHEKFEGECSLAN